MKFALTVLTMLALVATGPLAARSSRAQAKGEIVIGVQCDRTGPTQTRGHGPVPGHPRLHRPGELQGRGRRLPDQGHRDRPRVQGAAGGGVLRAPQEGRRGDHGRLRHPADLRPHRQADGGPHSRHLAGLRQCRRRRRHSLSVHLPDRRHLLVAGRRGGGIREEAAGRQPQGEEDRVPVLRQPRGARAHPGARGSRRARGLPAQDLRRSASRRGDGRAGAGHRPALPRRLRHRPSLRRRAVGVDQGAQARRLSAAQGGVLRVGLGRGQHRGGRGLRRGRGLLRHAVRRRGLRTIRC